MGPQPDFVNLDLEKCLFTAHPKEGRHKTGITIFHGKDIYTLEVGERVNYASNGISMQALMDTVVEASGDDTNRYQKLAELLDVKFKLKRRLAELHPTDLSVEPQEVPTCLLLLAILPLMLVLYFLFRRFRSSNPSLGLPSPRPKRIKKHGWAPANLD